ncbi:MAG TPA: hypothetical protein VF701_22300 [Thermoanaerobaculia bacterium]
MLLALLQLLLVCLAGYGVFLLYRRAASPGGWLAAAVATGFLIRAISGQLLFWISWLRLPIGEGLQTRRGFWFYALDAMMYFRKAGEAASGGVVEILQFSRTEASPFFTQVFAAGIYLFGRVPSVGLLLNLAAFVATCAVIVAIAPPGRLSTIAVAAVSLSPSGILWSTQPLKDILFSFLLVAFFGAIALWLRQETFSRYLLWGSVVVAIVYAVGGIRWYAALFLLVAMTLFVFTASLQARGRARTLAAGLLMIVASTATFMVSAGPYIPSWLQQALKPWESRANASERGPLSGMAAAADRTRSGFDSTGGATLIRPGDRLAPMLGSGGSADTRTMRLATGVAAGTLPLSIAKGLGLIEVGGGRGMWLFVELDTLVFDLLLVVVLVVLFDSLRKRAIPSPLTVLLLSTAILLGGAVFYVVSNYGTLFRHRQMVYVTLALVPVAVALTRQKTVLSVDDDVYREPRVSSGGEATV